jgi:hypothetical protein
MPLDGACPKTTAGRAKLLHFIAPNPSDHTG